LTGEAYFEVTKDQEHPFIVNTDDIDVKVLGTKFNVSHYPEDTSISTVLVEGSVELHEWDDSGKDISDPVLLKPGFMAEWNKPDRLMSVENVDTRIYTAWVQGKMIFRNTTFRKIRQALERKYNVTIINNNTDLDDQLFDATFDIETIEQVLQSFNKSYAINYKIENNKVIIN
jgi:ferric-dicitrate binding protein FerR (iron transport regulator)